MANVCFSADSWAVKCTPGGVCARSGGSCDDDFGGLEVLVAERVVDLVLGFAKNVTYTCMGGLTDFFEDAASPAGSCDMYVGSVHPFRRGAGGLVFTTPYFVGGVFAFFDNSALSYAFSGFEFVNPFSWTLWLAIAVFAVLLPVASTILEKDPGETWVDSYFVFHSDAWHAISGVDTLERGDDVNILSACLSIVTAIAARVLTAIYAANIATYLLSRPGLYPDVQNYGAMKEAGISALLSSGGVVDELSLPFHKNCSNSYYELSPASVPYSIALPRNRTTLGFVDAVSSAAAAVATHAEMAMFAPPAPPGVGCSSVDGGIGLGSTKYVFLIYVASCAAVAISSYAIPAYSFATRKLGACFFRAP